MFRSVPWVWGKGSLGDDRGCWMVAALARDRIDNEASSFSFDAIIFSFFFFFFYTLRNVYTQDNERRGGGISEQQTKEWKNMNE